MDEAWPGDGKELDSPIRPGVPEAVPGEVLRRGNLLAYDFSFSYRPDGSLGHLGFDRCHAYAKRWASSGRRDLLLEANHPELADAFREIREDAERLEFHLLPDHQRGRAGEVLPFPGFCRLDESAYTVVNELYPLPDGTYELVDDGPPYPDEEPDRLSDLKAPVATVRMLRRGELRLPCKVIVEYGGNGRPWVTGEALGAAYALARDCSGPLHSCATRRRSSGGSSTGCPRPGESG